MARSAPRPQQGAGIDFPEQTRRARDEDFKPAQTRAPGHARRPARHWSDAPLVGNSQRVVLAGVLGLHLLFAGFIWLEMQPRPLPAQFADVYVPVQLGQSLQVRFLQQARQVAPPPMAPLPQAPSRPVTQARRPVRERPAPDAMTAQIEAPAVAASVVSRPTPRLYEKTGRIVMAPAAAASAAVPAYVRHGLQGDTAIMRHTSPIPPRTTRFNHYFPPPNETLGGAALRHVVEAVVGTTTVNLPGGTHLKCHTLLGVPTPDCHDPPDPPPPTDGDERLSLAPPPLAVDPHAKPPPSIKSCIAEYRAGKPLPYGCPVDTPTRSVDVQINECIALYRTGRRLKTWCPVDTAARAARAARAGKPAAASSS